MDSLSYILLVGCFLVVAVITILVMRKTEKAWIGLTVSAICFAAGAVLFGLYANAYRISRIPTSEGFAVPDILRVFMLDDHLTAANYTTGWITASLLLVLCAAFLVYCIVSCRADKNKV